MAAVDRWQTQTLIRPLLSHCYRNTPFDLPVTRSTAGGNTNIEQVLLLFMAETSPARDRISCPVTGHKLSCFVVTWHSLSGLKHVSACKLFTVHNIVYQVYLPRNHSSAQTSCYSCVQTTNSCQKGAQQVTIINEADASHTRQRSNPVHQAAALLDPKPAATPVIMASGLRWQC